MEPSRIGNLQDWQTKGPVLWGQLHCWALTAHLPIARQWLLSFESQIGCNECRGHWRSILAALPPDLSSQMSLFSWTVLAHNAVNRRLGKPEWAQSDALLRWQNCSDDKLQNLPSESVVANIGSKWNSGQSKVTVNCKHASPCAKHLSVQCNLGLFGGTPYFAICRQCADREPVDAKQPAILKVTTEHGLRPNRDGNKVQSSPVVSLGPKPEEATERLILRSYLSPGDILMLTASVRDLHRTHPKKFATAVESPAKDLWENNPYICDVDESAGPWRKIDMHYPLINQSNQRPVHFLQGYSQFLSEQLGVTIPLTEFKGDVHLTEEERHWKNQVHEHFGFGGKFWVIVAGGKYDFTAKWWPTSFYQQVVDHFLGRIQFVQCGQSGHWHQPLRGVFNLVGKTTLRQFVRLMYHAEGVVCPVTFAMHLAAAVPTKSGRLRPCVVIAGGREPIHWESYPGHQFLHTIGSLSCCATGGCWKSRCQTVGDGDPKDRANLCERPVPAELETNFPQCMIMIRPQDVIRAVERFIEYV